MPADELALAGHLRRRHLPELGHAVSLGIGQLLARRGLALGLDAAGLRSAFGQLDARLALGLGLQLPLLDLAPLEGQHMLHGFFLRPGGNHLLAGRGVGVDLAALTLGAGLQGGLAHLLLAQFEREAHLVAGQALVEQGIQATAVLRRQVHRAELQVLQHQPVGGQPLAQGLLDLALHLGALGAEQLAHGALRHLLVEDAGQLRLHQITADVFGQRPRQCRQALGVQRHPQGHFQADGQAFHRLQGLRAVVPGQPVGAQLQVAGRQQPRPVQAGQHPGRAVLQHHGGVGQGVGADELFARRQRQTLVAQPQGGAAQRRQHGQRHGSAPQLTHGSVCGAGQGRNQRGDARCGGGSWGRIGGGVGVRHGRCPCGWLAIGACTVDAGPTKTPCRRRVRSPPAVGRFLPRRCTGTPPHNRRMAQAPTRIAVVEDDPPTRDQLIGWLRAARPDAVVTALADRDAAEAVLSAERFDLVTLDLELGRERHAGIALINLLNKRGLGTPVLVVSAMPAAVYRSIMKALDAWDYLQKTQFDEVEFIETVLALLRQTARPDARADAAPQAEPDPLIDPLRQRNPTWRGQRLNLPLTAQRILATLLEHRGGVVSYDQLYDVVKTGRNKDNVRKHVATIRDALREIDPAFDGIENVPMRGFRWNSAR